MSNFLLYKRFNFIGRDTLSLALLPVGGNNYQRGGYEGIVKKGNQDLGKVALDLKKTNKGGIKIEFIGDPSYSNPEVQKIGIGCLLMYCAILTANLNNTGYIVVQTPLDSIMSWYFNLGFYCLPKQAHLHDGDIYVERPMHHTTNYPDSILLPSDMDRMRFFKERFAKTRSLCKLQGGATVKSSAEAIMKKKGWHLVAAEWSV